jgi:hypothetical protein
MVPSQGIILQIAGLTSVVIEGEFLRSRKFGKMARRGTNTRSSAISPSSFFSVTRSACCGNQFLQAVTRATDSSFLRNLKGRQAKPDASNPSIAMMQINDVEGFDANPSLRILANNSYQIGLPVIWSIDFSGCTAPMCPFLTGSRFRIWMSCGVKRLRFRLIRFLPG